MSAQMIKVLRKVGVSTMKAVVYTRNNLKVPISKQFQECKKLAEKRGLKVAYHIDDTTGAKFHEAVNLVIANKGITSLIIYNKNIAFDDLEEYKFYCIYFVKLNKEMIAVK